MIRVDEYASRRASRFDEREPTRLYAVPGQAFSVAEHHRGDPHMILVDEVGGDQCL
jgi:hypothetical protein